MAEAPGGRERDAFPRTIPPDEEPTWAKYAEELQKCTLARYQLLRAAALANPRLPPATRNLLSNQPAQSVQAYELPR